MMLYREIGDVWGAHKRKDSSQYNLQSSRYAIDVYVVVAAHILHEIWFNTAATTTTKVDLMQANIENITASIYNIAHEKTLKNRITYSDFVHIIYTTALCSFKYNEKLKQFTCRGIFTTEFIWRCYFVSVEHKFEKIKFPTSSACVQTSKFEKFRRFDYIMYRIFIRYRSVCQENWNSHRKITENYSACNGKDK